jgi:hypothetical protein
VEAIELDSVLEDLETRVERLRSLYEQYFLGIEKIPPHVAQKDVDRRLYALRREQIRNTARRFKLQTIIQRYNTFQQYWMRIMREIENGTYRRHVLRAEQTLGVTNLLTPAERKRLALPERDSRSIKPPAQASGAPSGIEDAVESAGPLAGRLAATPAPDPRLESTSPTQPRSQFKRDLAAMLDDDLDDLDTKGLFEAGNELDDPLLSSMPPAPRKRKPSLKPVARRASRPTAEHNGKAPDGMRKPQPPSIAPMRTSNPAPPSTSDRGAPESFEPSTPGTHRRSLRPSRIGSGSGGPAVQGGLRLPASSAVAGRGLPPLQKPGTPRGAPPKIPSSPIIAVDAPRPAPQPTQRPHGSKLPSRPEERIDPKSSSLATPGSAAPKSENAPRPLIRPPPRQSGPADPLAGPPRQLWQPGPPPAELPRRAPGRSSMHTQPESSEKARPATPTPATASTQGSSRETTPRGLPEPRDSAIPRPRPSTKPRVDSSSGAKAAQPEAARNPGNPTERGKPPVPPRRGQARSEPARPDSSRTRAKSAEVLERSRIEQLAVKLRDARKQTHEASPVSVDALAKKLQTTAEELLKKHAGRRIDFDVVIKDGKAILKPIVR